MSEFRFPNATGQNGVYYAGPPALVLVESTETAIGGHVLFATVATADSWNDGDTIWIRFAVDDDNWAIWLASWDSATETLSLVSEEESVGTIADEAAVTVTSVISKWTLDWLRRGAYGDHDQYWDGVAIQLRMPGADESTDFSGCDESDNATAVTAYGGAAVSADYAIKEGQSVYLDGTGDYLSWPYAARFDLSQPWWEIEVSFALATGVTSGVLFSNATHGSNLDLQLGVTNTTTITLYTSGGSVNLAATVPTMSVEHVYELAIVGFPGIIAILFDGVPVAAKAMTMTNVSKNTVLLGAANWNNPSGYFKGWIGGVRWTVGNVRHNGKYDTVYNKFYSA